MRRADASASRALKARLESAFAGARPNRTVIGRSTNGCMTFAAVGLPGGKGEAEPFPTGCATKLLVAALLECKLRAHGLDHDVPIRRLLEIPSTAIVGETTLRHLLEHRHGLDDSSVGAAPRRADGRICVVQLLALLAERRFAAPGELYSYSNAGAWIAAAVLEGLERRPFEEQLRDDLLAPLGIAVRECHPPSRLADAPVCAATGGRLALSVGDWLTFLDACAPSASTRLPASGVRSNCGREATAAHVGAPLPGWHPLERGVHLGWKCYDGGWFGHQSVWPGASLLLRARPSDGSAIVVASESHHAAVVAARVLGRELPELAAIALPKPLSGEAAARLDLGSYCGRYAVAAESLEVELDGAGLALRSGRLHTRLIAAAGDIFFLKDGGPSRSFVQLIDRNGDAFRRLWDGSCVFPLAQSSKPVR